MGQDFEVAQTIYRQLGGGRFAAMTGVRDFVAGDDFLQLTLPRNASKANRLRITLDRAADLYNVRFYRRTGGIVDGSVKGSEPVKVSRAKEIPRGWKNCQPGFRGDEVKWQDGYFVEVK